MKPVECSANVLCRELLVQNRKGRKAVLRASGPLYRHNGKPSDCTSIVMWLLNLYTRRWGQWRQQQQQERQASVLAGLYGITRENGKAGAAVGAPRILAVIGLSVSYAMPILYLMRHRNYFQTGNPGSRVARVHRAQVSRGVCKYRVESDCQEVLLSQRCAQIIQPDYMTSMWRRAVGSGRKAIARVGDRVR